MNVEDNSDLCDLPWICMNKKRFLGAVFESIALIEMYISRYLSIFICTPTPISIYMHVYKCLCI